MVLWFDSDEMLMKVEESLQVLLGARQAQEVQAQKVQGAWEVPQVKIWHLWQRSIEATGLGVIYSEQDDPGPA